MEKTVISLFILSFCSSFETTIQQIWSSENVVSTFPNAQFMACNRPLKVVSLNEELK